MTPTQAKRAERAAFRRYDRARRQAPAVIAAQFRFYEAVQEGDTKQAEQAHADLSAAVARHPDVDQARRDWWRAVQHAAEVCP